MTLSFVTDTCNEEIIAHVGMHDDILITIINNLSSDILKVRMGAIRVVGNLSSSENSEILEKMLFHGVISKLEDIMVGTFAGLIKESLWTISNFAAANSQIIQSLFSNDNLVQRLSIFVTSPSLDIRKEALWIMSNSLTIADT
jgi:translation initiation factor 6 (eIF-6)